MILLFGCGALPGVAEETIVVERLPPVRRGARLGQVPPDEPLVVLAVGEGARQAAELLRRPADRDRIEAVLLAQPHSGPDKGGDLALWTTIGQQAAEREGPLFASWTSYHAPVVTGQRHPYNLIAAVGEKVRASASPGWSSPVDMAALRAWPEGEILTAEGFAWTGAPRVSVLILGGYVAVLDLDTPDPGGDVLATRYGPGALVRGVLLPRWRAGIARAVVEPAPAPVRASRRPAAARPAGGAGGAIGRPAIGPAPEGFDGLFDDLRGLGRAVGQGVRHARVIAQRTADRLALLRGIFRGHGR